MALRVDKLQYGRDEVWLLGPYNVPNIPQPRNTPGKKGASSKKGKGDQKQWQYFYTPHTMKMLAQITFKRLAGWPGQIYEAWVFENLDSIRRFFENVENMRPNLAAALQKHTGEEQARPIFVPRLVGSPTGRVLAKINDRRLWIALFVQGWGHRNRVLCEECEKTLKGTRVEATNPEEPGPDKPVRDCYVMFPFHGCVSIQGTENNKCGNCIYKECNCTMTNASYSNALGDRRLSGDGYVDVTEQWSVAEDQEGASVADIFQKRVAAQKKIAIADDNRFGPEVSFKHGI